jgi:hypothetical protein
VPTPGVEIASRGDDLDVRGLLDEGARAGVRPEANGARVAMAQNLSRLIYFC